MSMSAACWFVARVHRVRVQNWCHKSPALLSCLAHTRTYHHTPPSSLSSLLRSHSHHHHHRGHHHIYCSSFPLPRKLYLRLADNGITVIGDNTFVDLYSLHELDLSHNNITYISPQAFAIDTVAYNIAEINLTSNNLTYMDKSVLDTVPLARYVTLTCSRVYLDQSFFDTSAARSVWRQ
jgi:hypothetical protein